MDARDERVAELEAEIARLRGLPSGDCPWDLPNDPRADIDKTTPCPVCGMLGTMDAEDKCIAGPRSA